MHHALAMGEDRPMAVHWRSRHSRVSPVDSLTVTFMALSPWADSPETGPLGLHGGRFPLNFYRATFRPEWGETVGHGCPRQSYNLSPLGQKPITPYAAITCAPVAQRIEHWFPNSTNGLVFAVFTILQVLSTQELPPWPTKSGGIPNFP